MSLPLADARAISVCWTDTTPLTAARAAAAVTRLPLHEQERFARYRRPVDAHQFLVGRLLTRTWLSTQTGAPPEAWRFSEGPRGRPTIAAPATAWSFNLAHSGGLVACALAHGLDVGVDLENLRRTPMTRNLSQRFCSPEEAADIAQQPEPERTRRFLTYWTLKEAYLKALGLGIAVHLADISFNLQGPHPTVRFINSLAGTSTRWAFGLFAPTPLDLLSVAVPITADGDRPRFSVTELPLAALDLS